MNNKDLSDFKNTFTEEQRLAIWQYLLDHAKIQNNGYYGVLFYIRTQDDFWRRVKARYAGEYLRNNIEKVEMTWQQVLEKRLDSYKKTAMMGTIWSGYDQALEDSWFKPIWRIMKKYAKKKCKHKELK